MNNNNKNLQPKKRLRHIRWRLLDLIDRLKIVRQSNNQPLYKRFPIIVGLRVSQLIIELLVNMLSIPIYFTMRQPQITFSLYARRKGDTYIDSYIRFIRNAEFTISVILVTIVAVFLAIVSATFLRSKIFP
jgi:hypothetical protein